jgi:hypothetical protein
MYFGKKRVKVKKVRENRLMSTKIQEACFLIDKVFLIGRFLINKVFLLTLIGAIRQILADVKEGSH